MRERVRFRVRGHVQGIGYRYFVLETAERLRLAGWVRNLADGDVEGEAEGEAADLQAFLEQVRTAHPWARVDSLDKKDIPPIDQKGFRIAR